MNINKDNSRVPHLAEKLVCPECGESLKYSDDNLLCRTHGVFPIQNEVVSFIDTEDKVQEDHWLRNASQEMAADKVEAAHEFLQPLKSWMKQQSSISILDAGCGEGAHVSALSQEDGGYIEEGIALDIALSALFTAKRHASQTWQFVHGDMSNLPLKDNSIDAAITFGVLHLTEDPASTLKEIARVVKPGGIVGVWVFSGGSTTVQAGLRSLRAISKLVGPTLTTVIANIMVPFYGLFATRSGLTLKNASWKQVREVMMSNFSPPYMHFIDDKTLMRYFDDAGLDVTANDQKKPTTIWGLKR